MQTTLLSQEMHAHIQHTKPAKRKGSPSTGLRSRCRHCKKQKRGKPRPT